MDRRRLYEELQVEILSEQAHALAYAVRSLEEVLADLGRAPPERHEHVLDEAAERLWYVIVQRESIGLTIHDDLFEVLKVPAEVRGRMGLRVATHGKPEHGRSVP